MPGSSASACCDLLAAEHVVAGVAGKALHATARQRLVQRPVGPAVGVGDGDDSVGGQRVGHRRRDLLGAVVQQRRHRHDVDVPAAAPRDRAHVEGQGAAGDDRGAGGRGGAHPGKASWSMNRSLKSARPDSSTYSTSRRMDWASARSRSDSAAIFAPSPATLPADTIRGQGDPRHEADPHRAQRRQVGAEAPGQQHLRDVLGLDAQLAQQDVPAGGDRSLGELQLPHVALGEVHR